MGLKKQMFDEPFCWCIQYCFSSKLSHWINDRGVALEIMIMEWKYNAIQELKYKFVCLQNYIWKYNIRDLMMMNREKDRKQ